MEVARDSRGSPSWQDTEDNNTRAGIELDLGTNCSIVKCEIMLGLFYKVPYLVLNSKTYLLLSDLSGLLQSFHGFLFTHRSFIHILSCVGSSIEWNFTETF